MTQKDPGSDDHEFVSRQHDYVSKERARQARAHFEDLYETKVMQERLNRGVCIFCGQDLAWFARWLKFVRHRRCKTFSES